jgi:hypothetical protein
MRVGDSEVGSEPAPKYARYIYGIGLRDLVKPSPESYVVSVCERFRFCLTARQILLRYIIASAIFPGMEVAAMPTWQYAAHMMTLYNECHKPAEVRLVRNGVALKMHHIAAREQKSFLVRELDWARAAPPLFSAESQDTPSASSGSKPMPRGVATSGVDVYVENKLVAAFAHPGEIIGETHHVRHCK